MKLLEGLASQNNSSDTLKSSDFLHNFKAVNTLESSFFQPDKDLVLFNERYAKGEFNIMFSELNNVITLKEIHEVCTKLSINKAT